MRIHGRSGVAYLSLHSWDAASPVAFLSDWDIGWTAQLFDVTCVPDVQVIHAAGEPEAAGSFSGWYDTATAQTYAAAVDGLPRNMYLYPSTAFPGSFFYGLVLPDYGLGGGTASAVSVKVAWSAAGPVIFSGPTSPPGDTYAATYSVTY